VQQGQKKASLNMPYEAPRSEEWIREREAGRAEIHNRAVQGLFLLNGGGAVALLAALPQMWDKAEPIIPAIAGALIIMAAGLVLAGIVNFLRYESSVAHDKAETREKGKRFGRIWRWVAAFSLMMFVVAVSIVSWGIFRHWPPGT
jgi:hypothetical protein